MTEPAYTPADRLWLWWLGDPAHPACVGELSLVQAGRAVALAYDPQWLHSGFALSADLPLAPGLFQPVERDTAVGAVDDARPNRWGERVIRKFENSPRMSLLEYLLFAGDDRYGALGVGPRQDTYLPWRASPMPAFTQLEDMYSAVRKILANEAVPEVQRRLVRPGASLGGARPKSLVRIDGEPWIIKFSEGEDMDTPLVEHACMTLARACGIRTADTRAVPLGGRHAVAVRRFDRQGEMRLHAVSANVALRAAGEQLGYPQLALLLRRLAPANAIAEQQEELFRRMLFNIMMDNTDDHEKNHALVRQADGSYLLSPAFDIVPSAQGLGYQQMLVGDAASESTLDNALSQAMQFGLRPAPARNIASEMGRVVAGWKKHFRSLGVVRRDLDEIAQYIDSDRLRAQRGQ